MRAARELGAHRQWQDGRSHRRAVLIHIRPVAAAEWPTYRAVRLQALQESPQAFGSTYAAESQKSDQAWQSQVENAMASGQDCVLFALDDQQVRGLIWCKLAATEAGTADIYQMWVAPAVRGSGAGHSLLHAAVRWARQKAVRRVRLGVTHADSPAMRLYRNYGFVPIGALAPLRAGSDLQAQTLELLLDCGDAAAVPAPARTAR